LVISFFSAAVQLLLPSLPQLYLKNFDVLGNELIHHRNIFIIVGFKGQQMTPRLEHCLSPRRDGLEHLVVPGEYLGQPLEIMSRITWAIKVITNSCP
jgi:hypothetical protein